MKALRAILVYTASFTASFTTYAATYYVKAAGGNGDGLSDATAWSYAKLNSTAVGAADNVLFKRGDSFYGTLANRGGSATSALSYAAYGTGANPVITGMSTLTSWTASATPNVYYATLDVPELNVVVIDNILRGMGRYPKTGYLYNTWRSYNRLLTPPLPFNAIGYEVVLRKIRQITDRHIVVGKSGDTLTVAMGGAYHTNRANNNNPAYSISGMGFFVQGGLACLTQTYDWYYDSAAKRLYVYFPTAPSNYSVRVASKAQLWQPASVQNIKFTSIDFEGANFAGVETYQIKNVSFTDCNWRFCNNAIQNEVATRGFSIKRGSMVGMVNNGIYATDTVRGYRIDSLTVRTVGCIAGMGGSSDYQQLGLCLTGDSLYITNCKLDSVGYHPVVLVGNHVAMRFCAINAFGFVKDDAGGFYSVQFVNNGVVGVFTDQIIEYNTITNGYGNTAGLDPAGAEPTIANVHGIYLDARVSNYIIRNNIITGGSDSGIMLTDVKGNNSMTNNTISNWSHAQVQFYTSGIPLRTLTLTGNRLLAGIGQLALYIHQFNATLGDPVGSYGSFSANTYNRTGSDLAIQLHKDGQSTTNYKLSAFRALTGLDAGSVSNLRPATSGGKVLKMNGKVIMISP